MFGIIAAGFAAGLAMRAGFDLKEHVHVPDAVIDVKDRIVRKTKVATRLACQKLDQKLAEDNYED